MEISGYGSIFFSQEAEESARAARGKNNGQEGSALGLPGGSDTVSISEEARKLSEKMLLEKQEEQRRQEQEQSRQSSAALAGNGPGRGQRGTARQQRKRADRQELPAAEEVPQQIRFRASGKKSDSLKPDFKASPQVPCRKM